MNKEKINKFLGSELGKYIISLFYFLFIYTYFYLIAEKLTIFTTGYFFDMIITIGFVSLLFFLFKGKKRNVALHTASIIKVIIYIADYMYMHKFYSPASAGDLLLNFRWLDFGGYGIGLNLILIILIAFAVLYFIYLRKYRVKDKEVSTLEKRNYKYLFAAWLVLVPFIYCIFIGLQTYDTIAEYEASKTYIFDNGMGKQIAPGEFVENFGYSIFRYEDLNYVIGDIIYDFTR